MPACDGEYVWETVSIDGQRVLGGVAIPAFTDILVVATRGSGAVLVCFHIAAINEDPFQMRLSLSLRLALMFALLSLVTASAIGFYLYHSLGKELVRRDDQTLPGRLERMESLLNNTASIDVLRQQPQLYANMLGNTDNVLSVLNSDGDVLIEINPPGLPVPTASLATGTGVIFSSGEAGQPYRLASYLTRIHQRPLTLVAGKKP